MNDNLTVEEIVAKQIADYPRRIVCLTEETTETLYLLGQEYRIVGVSGYTARPPEARQKPRVSAFTSAKFDKIIELRPDLVLAFSDLQADITRELLARGLNVFAFNQRSIAEILEMILTLARITGVPEKGAALVDRLQAELRMIAASAARFQHRPRVFFEEWKEPLISGIRWVEELIEIAGGEPVFPELRTQSAAKNRIVDPAVVIGRDPEIVVASWCGMKVNKDAIRSREGWAKISAVRQAHIYEIKSTYILQPGPAALTEGVRQLHAILAHVAGFQVAPELRPAERMDADIISGEIAPRERKRMSIATKRGDGGQTSLPGGVRVSKSNPRVECYGTIDELISQLGFARSICDDREVHDLAKQIQRELFKVGSAIGTPPESKDPAPEVTSEMVQGLDDQVHRIEAVPGILSDWSIPGELSSSAAFDVARTVCRRAERLAVSLQEEGNEKGDSPDPQILAYLNRLSDLLWLMGRLLEVRAGADAALRPKDKPGNRWSRAW